MLIITIYFSLILVAFTLTLALFIGLSKRRLI
uniref:Cytochrome b6-f complex subunit 6 n=1 Tax=Cuscuta bonafortunae TaxID=1197926 RepID=A0A4Y6GTB4_9ASTE|nr:cytochrome b6/f complex subunit VI [Cuscuta bonafortunae]QDF46589.1 cytochrome b6/f complex subunit VI [Cuscuta bonafortunae]